MITKLNQNWVIKPIINPLHVVQNMNKQNMNKIE